VKRSSPRSTTADKLNWLLANRQLWIRGRFPRPSSHFVLTPEAIALFGRMVEAGLFSRRTVAVDARIGLLVAEARRYIRREALERRRSAEKVGGTDPS